MKTLRQTYQMVKGMGASLLFPSRFLLLVTCFSCAFTSCSVIDDDLSDCGFEVRYELKLETTIQTKLQLQLQTDQTLRSNLQLTNSLRRHLESIFRDHADDVDLSFYDVQGDSTRLEHDQHDMNGKEQHYTLNIPRRHYMHLATANVKQELGVEAFEAQNCHKAHLSHLRPDTVPSHTTGLFTARHDMDIKDSVNQTFNVQLYMANAATVLVVDTLGSGVRDIKVFATGFASGFNMADSTYTFAANPAIVRATPIEVDDRQYACYSTVNFPSRDRIIIPVGAPRRASSDDVADALWEYHLYITTASGSVTRSVLRSSQPLHAEQVLIVHVKMEPNGQPDPVDPTVGVNVTLNWNDGGQYNHEL